MTDIKYKNLDNEELMALLKKEQPEHPIYRSYVGPASRYDFVSAQCFSLLISLGLREYHQLLDIGCGSLRNGRLLIPYLNRGNYWGLEPNGWLVNDGIMNEIGRDMVTIKHPNFVLSDKYDTIPPELDFNYLLAHSVFTHAPLKLVEYWFQFANRQLSDNGIFIATFFMDKEDYTGASWVYPGRTTFKIGTIRDLASKYGLFCSQVNWKYHKEQTWWAFSKCNYKFKDDIGWNNPLTPPEL